VVLQLLLARCLEAAAQVQQQGDGLVLPRLRVARPGEFTERAFLNDKIDLAQAEAIADLIDASTEAAARSATRSLSGEFSRDIHALRDRLIHLRMLVEATLDFPEEEIDFLRKADAHGQLQLLQKTLGEVLQKARQGVLLREGIKVVIAGQPNAGKSSLLNALAGAELAIVTPIAGTTRDVVQQTIQIEGVPLHIIDTAGLRHSTDEVERMGIARAWDQIAGADVVLFLHDLTRLDDAETIASDVNLASAIAQKLTKTIPVIDVWNKSDAVQGAVPHVPPVHPVHGLYAHAHDAITLSAKTGAGLDALRRTLLALAGWQAAPEGVYLARERHLQALRRVDAHLMEAAALLALQGQHLDVLAEELRLAQQACSEITGEFSADDLLGVIFSSFCIGK
jgi:tRNA modification GTPase